MQGTDVDSLEAFVDAQYLLSNDVEQLNFQDALAFNTEYVFCGIWVDTTLSPILVDSIGNPHCFNGFTHRLTFVAIHGVDIIKVGLVSISEVIVVKIRIVSGKRSYQLIVIALL